MSFLVHLKTQDLGVYLNSENMPRKNCIKIHMLKIFIFIVYTFYGQSANNDLQINIDLTMKI